jgi:hypothetical protein
LVYFVVVVIGLILMFLFKIDWCYFDIQIGKK